MNDLDTWTRQLAEALDVDPNAVDRDAILDVAKVAAHNVVRPAAPLTTFLAGYAAGLRGGNDQEVAAALETARNLAEAAASGPES